MAGAKRSEDFVQSLDPGCGLGRQVFKYGVFACSWSHFLQPLSFSGVNEETLMKLNIIHNCTFTLMSDNEEKSKLVPREVGPISHWLVSSRHRQIPRTKQVPMYRLMHFFLSCICDGFTGHYMVLYIGRAFSWRKPGVHQWFFGGHEVVGDSTSMGSQHGYWIS